MLVRLKSVPFVREGFDLGNYEYQRITSHSDRWAQANFEEISIATRLLFEKSWGFSIEEQLRLESAFRVSDLPEDWAQVPIQRVNASCDPWELPLDEEAAGFVARYTDQL
jgi:hypothetical protein